MIENNPYEGLFNKAQQERLVEYIDVGETIDAQLLGLDSKFQLEACTEHLFTEYKMVLLQVSLMPVHVRVYVPVSRML